MSPPQYFQVVYQPLSRLHPVHALACESNERISVTMAWPFLFTCVLLPSANNRTHTKITSTRGVLTFEPNNWYSCFWTDCAAESVMETWQPLVWELLQTPFCKRDV